MLSHLRVVAADGILLEDDEDELDEPLPAQRHVNGEILTSPDGAVFAVLDEGAAIVDARSASAYRAAHLPSALHLGLEVAPERMMPATAQLDRVLTRAGLHQDRPVILYDDATASGRAAQLFVLLEHLGFTRVKILEGGLAAWRADGCSIVSAPRSDRPHRGPRDEPGRRTPSLQRRRPHLSHGRTGPMGDLSRGTGRIITPETVRAELGTRRVVVLDGRPVHELERSPDLGSPRGDHVPGARSLPPEQLIDAGGAWLSGDHIDAALLGAGVTPADDVIVTGGRRGALLYFALRLVGRTAVRALDAG
ncbi:hypothetical protein L6R52_28985 [Myxococcota bacterium]|nr:hypothetical protein [Myxococcota bacterium]